MNLILLLLNSLQVKHQIALNHQFNLLIPKKEIKKLIKYYKLKNKRIILNTIYQLYKNI